MMNILILSNVSLTTPGLTSNKMVTMLYYIGTT